jgi:hypothetical protein
MGRGARLFGCGMERLQRCQKRSVPQGLASLLTRNGATLLSPLGDAERHADAPGIAAGGVMLLHQQCRERVMQRCNAMCRCCCGAGAAFLIWVRGRGILARAAVTRMGRDPSAGLGELRSCAASRTRFLARNTPNDFRGLLFSQVVSIGGEPEIHGVLYR